MAHHHHPRRSYGFSLSLSLLPFGWKKICCCCSFGVFSGVVNEIKHDSRTMCAVANNTHSVDRYQNLSFSLSLLFYFLLVHKVDGYAPHNHSFQITRVVVVV
jgi:hypothetical protein